MPYILDIKNKNSLEERLLYEAISDCYLRLIQVFDRLIASSVPFLLTISLSPVLMAQIENPKMPDRFIEYLKLQIKLADKEINRTINVPSLAPLPRMYKELYEQALITFMDRCNGNIIETFKSYQERGLIQIITCPATHPYLPLMRPTPSAIRAQINVGINEYERFFKIRPQMLWLPECGYFPGLDQYLLQADIHCTFLDTDTIKCSKPLPKYGTYAPVQSPLGLVAFGRDFQTARQVWSAIDGYPGDPDYRDFYRDIGFDLDFDYLHPYLPHGIHSFTGFKYYKIASQDGEKKIYTPELSEQKVSIHVDDFLAHRLNIIRELSGLMDSPPVICAFYDAELFGHWWFEGPLWLEMLFKKMAECDGFLEGITPDRYLRQNSKFQIVQPSGGSWGWKGYHEVWLNSRNTWVYPHLFKAGEKMEQISKMIPHNKLEERAFNQAGKELMLAQSSDWTFILHDNTLTDYVTRRIKEHIGRFWRLIKQIDSHSIDRDWLKEIEEKDNIFPTFSYKSFSPG